MAKPKRRSGKGKRSPTGPSISDDTAMVCDDAVPSTVVKSPTQSTSAAPAARSTAEEERKREAEAEEVRQRLLEISERLDKEKQATLAAQVQQPAPMPVEAAATAIAAVAPSRKRSLCMAFAEFHATHAVRKPPSITDHSAESALYHLLDFMVFEKTRAEALQRHIDYDVAHFVQPPWPKGQLPKTEDDQENTEHMDNAEATAQAPAPAEAEHTETEEDPPSAKRRRSGRAKAKASTTPKRARKDTKKVAVKGKPKSGLPAEPSEEAQVAPKCAVEDTKEVEAKEARRPQTGQPTEPVVEGQVATKCAEEAMKTVEVKEEMKFQTTEPVEVQAAVTCAAAAAAVEIKAEANTQNTVAAAAACAAQVAPAPVYQWEPPKTRVSMPEFMRMMQSLYKGEVGPDPAVMFRSQLAEAFIGPGTICSRCQERIASLGLPENYSGPVIRKPLKTLSANEALMMYDWIADGNYPPPKHLLAMIMHGIRTLRMVPNVIGITLKGTQTADIIGDIHGELSTVHRVFDKSSVAGLFRKSRHVIFLGDYIDKGPNSILTLLSVLLMKIAYPENVHMLRGNHETLPVAMVGSFRQDVLSKYSYEVFALFTELFDSLPLACTINHDTFIVHGGIPRGGELEIEQIHKWDRTTDTQLGMCPDFKDMLWSDPQDKEGSEHNTRRNAGVLYGPDVVDTFLKINGLRKVVRGHTAEFKGYRKWFDGAVHSVHTFSDTTSKGPHTTSLAIARVTVKPSSGHLRVTGISVDTDSEILDADGDAVV
eukprot:m51a1_g3511 hypothetical protein (766) ;mRNA; r:873142-875879